MKLYIGHNPENRTELQIEKIHMIENSYPDLYRAYQLKEGLRLILHIKDHELAKHELDIWIEKAKSCGLKPMSELADKIERHRTNILNSIQYQANSAKSESTNTTIKYLIKLARGFRTLENMFALIYLKCSDIKVNISFRFCQVWREVPAKSSAKGTEEPSFQPKTFIVLINCIDTS